MDSNGLIIAIMAAYKLRRPTFLWGAPGIGKSDIVAQATRQLGIELAKDKKSGLKRAEDFQLIDFRMALRDPTDIKGFPMPDQSDKTMKFFRDAELPTSGFGILFMDELNSAAPATQAAGMQLTLKNHEGKHTIGDYELPPGFAIIAAGNRETDRGVVHRMPSPLRNRFTHLHAEVDKKAWIEWALHNDVSAELIAFHRWKDDLLFKFDPKLDSNAFPTPRSWVATEAFFGMELPADVRYELVKGTVGDGPGAEYIAFRKLVDQLPSLEEIRMNPKGAKLPGADQLSARFAIVTLMGANATETSFEAFLEYSERIDTEFQCIYIRDALARAPKIQTTKAYAKWAMKNSDVIL